MKRCLACMTAVCLLLGLCACVSKPIRPVPPELPDSFRCRTRILADRQTVECEWIMTHGESAMRILSPTALENMTVQITPTGAQIARDGVSAPLQDTSQFVQLANAYSRLLQTPITPVQTAQGWLYDAKQDGGFTVLQDADSGIPLRISIPASGITAAMTAMPVTESVSDT